MYASRKTLLKLVLMAFPIIAFGQPYNNYENTVMWGSWVFKWDYIGEKSFCSELVFALRSRAEEKTHKKDNEFRLAISPVDIQRNVTDSEWGKISVFVDKYADKHWGTPRDEMNSKIARSYFRLEKEVVRTNLTRELSNFTDVAVVDRRHLDKAYEELGVINSEDLDPKRIAELGRMVNANYIIFPKVKIRFKYKWTEFHGRPCLNISDAEVEYETDVLSVETGLIISVIQTSSIKWEGEAFYE